MGLVFVLLLGEIDLSAGFASGVCGAVMAILLTNHGWHWYTAIPAALVTGLVIGFVLGFLVAKVGIPSFVVTLAAFLGLPGHPAGAAQRRQQRLDPRHVRARAGQQQHVGRWLSWVLAIVAVVGYALVQFTRIRSRRGPRPGHRPDGHRARADRRRSPC